MRLLGGLVWVVCLWAQTPTIKLDDPPTIARGAAIFASNCGIGYCHGKEGRAGRGPRLAGRKFEKEYLFKSVWNGVSDSLMPAFKDRLSADETWAVVAYILSLSPQGAGAAPAAPIPESPAPHPAPRIADPNAGDPEVGRALFFDVSNPKHCAVCHRFQGRGGEVGPDLTPVSERNPQEILRDILDPDARLAVEPLAVVTRSGERLVGVKGQETPELIRIYDTRSLPPVLRTIYKDQIQAMTTERHSPMPDDYGRVYSRKQLLDLVAFLKGVPVRPEEAAAAPPK